MRRNRSFAVILFFLLLAPLGREGLAAEWLDWLVSRVGAELGMADAQYQLGQLYEKKGGPSANMNAVSWYRKSADQGNLDAQARLGILLEKGKGTSVNLIESYIFYNIAALKGDKAAEENRDALERRMNPADIATAQKITRERMRQDAGQER